MARGWRTWQLVAIVAFGGCWLGVQLALLVQHKEEFDSVDAKGFLNRAANTVKEFEETLQNGTILSFHDLEARIRKAMRKLGHHGHANAIPLGTVVKQAKDPLTRLVFARAAEAKRLAALGEHEAANAVAALNSSADRGPVPPLSEPGDNTTIVLEISSFLDGERCGRTLGYAFAEAVNPSRLRIHVLQARSGASDHPDCLATFKGGRLRELCAEGSFQRRMVGPYQGVEPSESLCAELALQAISAWVIPPAQGMGPVHQRGLANLLLRYEREDDMCISTDSHMGFVKSWDRLLIAEWLSLRNEFGVLTVYPAGFQFLGQDPRHASTFPTFCGYVHETSGMERGMPRGCGPQPWQRRDDDTEPPSLTMNWAAGFSFHRCHAERTAPADYHLRWMFSGEEGNRAVRLWTHGYDLYIPTMPIVLHDYSSAKQLFWSYRNQTAVQLSQKRMRRLLRLGGNDAGVDEPVPPYSLGQQRTMEQFVNWSRSDLGETWGPWLREHGLEPWRCGFMNCRTLRRVPVSNEVSMVASVGARPPERGSLRLSAFPSGRLEVYDGARWGTVCGDPWPGGEGAFMVCQHLGYESGTSAVGGSHAVPRPAVAGNRACNGSEPTIFDCPLREGLSSELAGCRPDHDVWISCKDPLLIPLEHDTHRGCCQVSPQDNQCAAYEYQRGCCRAGERGCEQPACERGFWNEHAVYDPTSKACRQVGAGGDGVAALGRHWQHRWEADEAYPVPVH